MHHALHVLDGPKSSKRLRVWRRGGRGGIGWKMARELDDGRMGKTEGKVRGRAWAAGRKLGDEEGVQREI